MSELIQVFSAPLAERIGWVLVHSIWQGIIIALLLAVVLRLLLRRSAQSRYLAASIALAAIVICPLMTNSPQREANANAESNVGTVVPLTPAGDVSAVPSIGANALVQGLGAGRINGGLVQFAGRNGCL